MYRRGGAGPPRGPEDDRDGRRRAAICGTDDKLKGVLIDRDIVIKVLGAGKDPASTNAGELRVKP